MSETHNAETSAEMLSAAIESTNFDALRIFHRQAASDLHLRLVEEAAARRRIRMQHITKTMQTTLATIADERCLLGEGTPLPSSGWAPQMRAALAQELMVSARNLRRISLQVAITDEGQSVTRMAEALQMSRQGIYDLLA